MDNITMNRINAFFDSKQQEMTETLLTITKMESPSADKARVDALCDYIRSRCENMGMKTELYPCSSAGNSLKAVLNPEAPGKAIAFLGHMDTVHPVGSFETSIEGDEIHGPGVYDMKGGLVTAMYICLALKELGYKERPVMLLFTGDEETAHKNRSGGERVFLQDPEKIAAALNFECGRLHGNIVVGRKMAAFYKMKVYGVAAHAGNEPHKGRSAILEAAHKIIAIQSEPVCDGTTYNCGVIRGGTVPNVVPEYCEFDIDVRVFKTDAIKQVNAFLHSVADSCTVEGTRAELIEPESLVLKPMEPTEKNMALFEKYKISSRAMNESVEISYEISGGGSDASFTSAAGIPTICAVGIRGNHCHSRNEYALLSSMAERGKVITHLVLEFEDLP